MVNIAALKTRSMCTRSHAKNIFPYMTFFNLLSSYLFLIPYSVYRSGLFACLRFDTDVRDCCYILLLEDRIYIKNLEVSARNKYVHSRCMPSWILMKLIISSQFYWSRHYSNIFHCIVITLFWTRDDVKISFICVFFFFNVLYWRHYNTRYSVV